MKTFCARPIFFWELFLGWFINVKTTVCFKFLSIWNECAEYSLKAYTSPKAYSESMGSLIADVYNKGPKGQHTNYHFLHLDENFAVVYFCTMLDGSMMQTALVLSRQGF